MLHSHRIVDVEHLKRDATDGRLATKNRTNSIEMRHPDVGARMEQWGEQTVFGKKSISRVKSKLRALLRPSNIGPWAEVRDQVNRVLRGWSGYFSYGTRSMAYQSVNRYVYDAVCHFLRRRQQLPSRGTARFSADVLAGPLGILRLTPLRRGVGA